MKTRPLLIVVAAILVGWGCASGSAATADAAPPRSDVEPAPRAPSAARATDVATLYTADQARRGETVYERVCLECHTKAEFTERPFLFAWEGTSVAQLYTYIAENMPDDGPGSLPEQSYLDSMAYILELNGYPAGDMELNADLDRMGSVPFQAHTGGRP